jgi:serine/threonine protein kinase
MGEVYRAEDTRLHRLVAIKILSHRYELTPHAIKRFEREARAAASLSHPNICTIYDVGTDPPFIAMELLEGETLQQRLARGPLDVMAAVDTMLALVDALELAHGKGIIHRDIKPANIFLTERGPKVLDFGVAKALPPASAATSGATSEATRSQDSLLTDEGAAVGTVAYMSPEQLRGRALDARSDLFSLGLVMYEMVTGRPAFSGETSAVIAAAILEGRPVLPSEIRQDVPPRLEDVSAAELRADLRRFKRETESGSGVRRDSSRWRSTPAAAGPADADRARTGGAQPARPRRVLLLAAAGLAVVIAALAFVLWPRIGALVGNPSSPVLQNLQVSQVTVSGNAWRPALSPDGKYVVYIHRDGLERSLRIRQLGTDRDVEIVAAQPGLVLQAAAVTPDGQFLDFVRGKTDDLTLWRVPFLGGSPKRVIDGVNSAIGWSPDGRQFAFVRGTISAPSALVVADADGRNERVLATRTMPAQFLTFPSRATPSGQGASIHPAWSPDGRTIALIGLTSVDGVMARETIFVDVATGTERSIPFRDGGSADGIEWLDPAHLVVSHIGRNDAVSQLWVVSYPHGSWSRLTNDLSNYASLALSADGESLAVARWDHQVAVSMLEGASREPVDVVPPGPFVGEDVAWAGDTLLYAVLSPKDNTPSIWALRPGESNPQELIENAYSPAATPDGSTIVFSRIENARRGIWRTDREGRGAVAVGASASDRVNVTPDGRHALYLSLDSGEQAVWMVPLAGGKPARVNNVYSYLPVASPDGQSIAFVSLDEQKRSVIAVCSLTDCSSTRTLPVPRRPAALRWTPDGRGLAYATLSNIWVQPLDGRPPSQLTRFREDDHRIEEFEWSADGKRLAFTRSRTTWDIVLFRGAKGN